MTVLGLDFGEKKIGLAISKEGIAFEYQTLSFLDLESVFQEIYQICQKEKIKKIIVGLSKNKERKIGFQGERQVEFAQKLEKRLKIPIIYEDESLTSREAARILKEQGVKKNEISEKIDSKSAQLILQSYLEKSK